MTENQKLFGLQQITLVEQNTNPPRVLVFEARGDGSEGIGVEAFGNSRPNCQWTITSDDNTELRPLKLDVTDIDSDV